MNRSPFSYNEAINPRTFTICSVELRPFCLGHFILLEQIQSPFLTDNPLTSVDVNEGLYHFLMFLLICSGTYEDGHLIFHDEDLLKKKVKQIQRGLYKNMRLSKDWNVFEKFRLLKDYVQFFTKMPVFQIEQKSDRLPSGIDWKQNLFTIAKNEFGYADSEVLNMSLRRLFFEWCSFAEKNGGIRVQNAEEIDNLEYMMAGAKKNTQTASVKQ